MKKTTNPKLKKYIVRVESHEYHTVYERSQEDALHAIEREYERKHGAGSFDNVDVSVMEVPY